MLWEGAVFLNFIDVKYLSQYCGSIQTFNNQNFKTQPRVSVFTNLSFQAPTPQNGQTRSNNLSAAAG